MYLISLTPSEGVQAGDLYVYYVTGLELSQSRDAWIRSSAEFGYRAPLYFAYVAAVFKTLGGDSYHTAQLANLLLFLFMLIVLYKLVSRFFGTNIAVLSVLLRVFMPNFMVSDIFVMSERLFDLLLLGLFLLFTIRDKPTLFSRFFLGALSAAAILTREYAQGIAAILIVLSVWDSFRTKNYPALLKHSAVFGLGLLLFLAPWMWRNTVVWGSPFPLMLTSGVNLHMGNNPGTSGVWKEIDDPEHLPTEDLGFGTRASDRWHKNKAIEYVIAHPVRFIRNGFLKLAYFVWPHFHRNDLYHTDILSSSGRLLKGFLCVGGALSSALVWIFGLLGLIYSSRALYSRLLLVLLSYTTAVVFVAFGSPRFAEPILLLLIPFSILAVRERGEIWKMITMREGRSLAAVGALFALALFWASVALSKIA